MKSCYGKIGLGEMEDLKRKLLLLSFKYIIGCKEKALFCKGTARRKETGLDI